MVGGLCCCALMLIHALICVFLVYAGFAAVPGGVQIRASLVAAVPGGVQIRGSLSLVCKAAAAFVQERPGVLKLAYFLPAFPLGVTGWLAIEHGHIVRFVDGGFGTVRMCVAGGVAANVVTCFSVGGTGLNGVTVRLFFNAGVIGDLRVVLIFRISLSGSGVSFFPACSDSVPWVRRRVVLRAGGPGVWWWLSVSLRRLAR